MDVDKEKKENKKEPEQKPKLNMSTQVKRKKKPENENEQSDRTHARKLYNPLKEPDTKKIRSYPTVTSTATIPNRAEHSVPASTAGTVKQTKICTVLPRDSGKNILIQHHIKLQISTRSKQHSRRGGHAIIEETTGKEGCNSNYIRAYFTRGDGQVRSTENAPDLSTVPHPRVAMKPRPKVARKMTQPKITFISTNKKDIRKSQ